MFLSVFYMMGITSEPVIRFIALFIPSIILIFLTYLLLSKMYNKKVGLISALILTVLWEHVFYSNRFHTENLALIFQFLAIFLTFSLWEKGKNYKFFKKLIYILAIILLSGLSILSRPGNMFFVPAIVIFLFLYFLFSTNLRSKTKDYLLIFTVMFSIIFSYFLIPIFAKIPMLANYYFPESPLAWRSLKVFNGFFLSNMGWGFILLIAFFLGIFIFLGKLLLSYGFFKKMFLKEKSFSSDFFNFIIIISVISPMIFLLRVNNFEYRWFFPILPAMLGFTSLGIISFSEFVEKKIGFKNLAVFLIILILLLGCYPQLKHTDTLVKIKLTSYGQIKESGLWIKENSHPSDVVVSASITQHSYYTERKIIDFFADGSNENETAFNLKLEEYKPRYIIISVFEGHQPQWAFSWPERNQERITPVKVYTMNTAQGEQPVLVIYEFNYPSF